MKEGCEGSAFPMPAEYDVNAAGIFRQIAPGEPGLSPREYAAIHLRIDDSGTDWLDEMIRAAMPREL